MAHALLPTCRSTCSSIFRSLQSLVPLVTLFRTIASVSPSNEEFRTVNIQDKEPNYPIVGQLGLFIRQNPIVALVHEMWMGYWDDKGLVGLLNEVHRSNYFYARRDWNTLTADEKAQLQAFWKSDGGRFKDFRSTEFAKHAQTAYGHYKPRLQ